MALVDFLKALLDGGQPSQNIAGAPMNGGVPGSTAPGVSPLQLALSNASSDQGTAGPVGTGAYQDTLQRMFTGAGHPQGGGVPSGNPGEVHNNNQPPPNYSPTVNGRPPSSAPASSGGANGLASVPAYSAGYSHPTSGGVLGGLAQGLRDIFDPQAAARNQTVDWLRRQGLDEGTATLVAGNKPLLNQYLASRMQGGKSAEFNQRAAAAKQYGLDPTTPEGRNFILTGKIDTDTTKATFGPIGQDEYGNTTYGWRDPKTQKVTPANGPSVDGSSTSGTYDNSTVAMLHGDDFLKTIPPTLADQVKAYASGKMPMPSGYALKSPYFQKMMQMVTQYDPTFDAVNYNARAKTRADFTSGKSAQSINALNTVIGHLGTLSAAADALNNSTIPMWNAVANTYENATGDPRIKQFDTTKKAVVDELTRVWRGSGGSEGDIKTWSDQINASNSPAQLHSVIGQIGDLLESKINALAETYKQGMGTTADPIQFVTPKAQITLDALRSAGSESSPPDESGPSRVRNPATPGTNAPVRAVNPQTGQRLELQNGKWVPVQ